MKLQPMVGSKYLERKWRKQEFEEHQRRIQNMKSEVVAQIQIQQKQTCVIDPRARMQIRDAYAESKLACPFW